MKRFFKTLHQLLLRIAHAIGRVNTVVLMSFSFYLLLTPLGLLRRLLRRHRPGSGWQPRPPLPPDHFEKQW